MATSVKVRYGDNLAVTDEGGNVIRVDAVGGPTGPQGLTGPVGPTGPTGPTGPAPGGLGALLYTGAGPAAVWTDPTVLKIGAIGGGSIAFSDGGDLYRSAPNVLAATAYFGAGNNIQANNSGTPVVIGETGVGPGLRIGTDVMLYRSAADVLKTDDAVVAVGGLSTLAASVDTQPTFRANPSGKLEWGVGGTTVPDTLANLYRTSAGRMAIDGGLSVAGKILLHTDGGLYFGPPNDTTIYRTAAASLRTNSSVLSDSYWSAHFATANQVNLGNMLLFLAGTGPGLGMGNPIDTVLYRSAAGVLKTNGALDVGGDLTLSGAAAHLRAANTVAAAVGGANVAKLPIYSAANVLIGYIPIYAT